MVKEIWKDVVGYEGLYQVSNLGRVKSLERASGKGSGNRYRPERILKQIVDKCGYLEITLCLKGIQKKFRVHRLIASAFIINIKNKSCVNHINGVKADNRVENLEWCTHSENLLHAYDLGLITTKGERNSYSKLKESDVLEIRKRISMGEKNIDLANEFRVNPVTISDIKLRKTWSHI